MRASHRPSTTHPLNRDPLGQRTIYALPPSVLGASVVYTSAPSRQEAGPCLALALLRALARLDPRWSAPADESKLILHKSALGGPHLRVGDREGPFLSFSHGKGLLWAAMSGRRSVGIDVAYPEEFTGDYPFARAFTTEELDSARTLCPDDTARGAALMWAAKEASVKATGAGFNSFDPLEVRVGTPLFREQGILFEVRADRPISTWVRTEGRGWLSVALA